MYVFRFGLQEDLSFDGVGRSLKAMLGDLYDRPFTETDYENSQKMRKFAEERRVKAMQEYLANKIRNI